MLTAAAAVVGAIGVRETGVTAEVVAAAGAAGRLKLLAKWDPKRYGDKQEIEHTGNLFDSLLATVNGTSLKPVADE